MPKGAYKKSPSEMKCWKRRNDDRCSPPSDTTTPYSFVQQQVAHVLQTSHVRGDRCSYCILRVQIATKRLVEQQSIVQINSAKRRRLRWCSKLTRSKQQRSVQVRIVRQLRWHETSAQTPNTYQLRDGTRTASEDDVSVIQLQDAETHPREGVT